MTWLIEPTKQTKRVQNLEAQPQCALGRDRLCAVLGTPRRARMGGLGFARSFYAGVATCGLVALVLTLGSLVVEVVCRCLSVHVAVIVYLPLWALRRGDRVLNVPMHHFLLCIHGGLVKTFVSWWWSCRFAMASFAPTQLCRIGKVWKADLGGVGNNIQRHGIDAVHE